MDNLSERRHPERPLSLMESDKIVRRSEPYMRSWQDGDAQNPSHKKSYTASWPACLGTPYCLALDNGITPYDGDANPAAAIIGRKLSRVISVAFTKFGEVDAEELREFVSTPEVLDIPHLPERLSAVFELVHAFIGRLNRAGKSRIGVFHDGDSEDKLITIKWYVNASVDQCIKWADEMVSAIIEMDEDMLDIIMVGVVAE